MLNVVKKELHNMPI